MGKKVKRQRYEQGGTGGLAVAKSAQAPKAAAAAVLRHLEDTAVGAVHGDGSGIVGLGGQSGSCGKKGKAKRQREAAMEAAAEAEEARRAEARSSRGASGSWARHTPGEDQEEEEEGVAGDVEESGHGRAAKLRIGEGAGEATPVGRGESLLEILPGTAVAVDGVALVRAVQGVACVHGCAFSSFPLSNPPRASESPARTGGPLRCSALHAPSAVLTAVQNPGQLPFFSTCGYSSLPFFYLAPSVGVRPQVRAVAGRWRGADRFPQRGGQRCGGRGTAGPARCVRTWRQRRPRYARHPMCETHAAGGGGAAQLA